MNNSSANLDSEPAENPETLAEKKPLENEGEFPSFSTPPASPTPGGVLPPEENLSEVSASAETPEHPLKAPPVESISPNLSNLQQLDDASGPGVSSEAKISGRSPDHPAKTAGPIEDEFEDLE